MSARDLGALLLLGALWGGSYIFIRVAVPELGPTVLMDLRVLGAAAALILYAAASRRLPSFKKRWRSFVVLGALNAALPFSLIAFAELHVTASLAAILVSATPLFAACVSAIYLGDALTIKKVLGLLVGVAGVAITVGWSPLHLGSAVALSVAALLTAALFYSFGGVYAKRNFVGFPPLTLAIGQQLGAGLVLLTPAAATLPEHLPSAGAVLAVTGLALLSTALAYMFYFRLLDSVGPTKTLTVTFLTPAFGLLWGVLFLGEPVEPGMILGFAVILLSLVLVAGIGPRKPVSDAQCVADEE